MGAAPTSDGSLPEPSTGPKARERHPLGATAGFYQNARVSGRRDLCRSGSKFPGDQPVKALAPPRRGCRAEIYAAVSCWTSLSLSTDNPRFSLDKRPGNSHI